MLGFHRRFVRRCEWLMLMPNDGRFPHTSQTAAMASQISIPTVQTMERLRADDLVAVVIAYREALRSHQELINRLNVYPVPDGDTGTNMALTVESILLELGDRRHGDMADTAEAISHGSLMGARGNSGVILSQVLRGLADAVRECDGVDAAVLAEGLVRAADGAYRAVQSPVEGTILTVARAAADGARAAGPQAGMVQMLESSRQSATDALARTPDLLPVLKTAGVVDAGGTGLVLLLDAFLHVADGRPLPEPPASPDAAVVAGSHETQAPGEGLRYEVMYLLEAPDESVPSFREVWAGIGDSIVVVGGDGIWNCHIHTDDIGGAIEAAIEAGRPRQIRVTDLWEQVEEERWVREAAASPDQPEPPAEPVNCAVVAVCTGEGIRRIFWSLGVHHVVSGGQSMNPSTADLLAAINAAPGEEVVILPNNKNIVPVAEQAAAKSAKTVRVLSTRGIQEGFAALMEYDPEGDAEANLRLMTESAGRVVAGELTRAVRPSVCDAGPIAEGDFLGLSRERIEVVSPDLAAAATGLLQRLIDAQHHEIVTIIAGEGAGAADTRRITEWIDEHHPGVTAEIHQGGQPLYPYLFSVE
jgi:DAK2 domain fusion protein YloV